jgi:hypothetical protein
MSCATPTEIIKFFKDVNDLSVESCRFVFPATCWGLEWSLSTFGRSIVIGGLVLRYNEDVGCFVGNGTAVVGLMSVCSASVVIDGDTISIVLKRRNVEDGASLPVGEVSFVRPNADAEFKKVVEAYLVDCAYRGDDCAKSAERAVLLKLVPASFE